MKLVMICFLVFLSLSTGVEAELGDFSSPYPKSEHFLSPKKSSEYNQVRKYGTAVIWHAPPIETQLANPELLKSESIDELAISYLLEGCRQENPEFVKIEVDLPPDSSDASFIVGETIMNKTSAK